MQEQGGLLSSHEELYQHCHCFKENKSEVEVENEEEEEEKEEEKEEKHRTFDRKDVGKISKVLSSDNSSFIVSGISTASNTSKETKLRIIHF